MEVQTYRTKPKIMGLDLIKAQLIERIKNGDEQLIRVMFAVSEAMNESDNDFSVEAYEASLKPMTVEELIARAQASNRAIEAGEHVDIEEALAELGD